MPLASVALLLVLLLAACGADGEEAGAPDPAQTDVQITFWPAGTGGAGEAFEATLTCAPPGGTHPDPEAACAALEANADMMEPLPPETVCTQVYGGPEEAEVAGVVGGRDVLARFSRQNGCEIARWDALEPLLRLDRG